MQATVNVGTGSRMDEPAQMQRIIDHASDDEHQSTMPVDDRQHGTEAACTCSYDG